MIGHIAAAEGAPCPTLVLDSRQLPQEHNALLDVLAHVRPQLAAAGHPDVLKIALLAPAAHPMFDLTYRFVQCIPGRRGDAFDLVGSCGHSIVAATFVANRLGWIPQLAPSHRVRVHVENNADTVVCEVDELHRSGGNVTVHFLEEPDADPASFLPTGAMLDTLRVGSTLHRVSLVSMGNPYVFVRARELGVTSKDQLFADDPELFQALVDIRAAAATRWGFPATSVFPKIAAVDHFTAGHVTVRAMSVPKWHPTLALTGATCLAVASVIQGTVAHEVAQEAGCGTGSVAMETPDGVVVGRPALIGPSDNPRLAWISVSGKRASYLQPISLDLVLNDTIKEVAA
ncbi:PrpF domain-containing protein [Streptomyces sp. NPDC052101]|uniref:PrpF domain-containing protein n=1 Tax=Streptomyces sp. NPDC052101 TaxID=3155763 RepID=UPI00341C31D7